jgi:hypothetical protein
MPRILPVSLSLAALAVAAAPASAAELGTAELIRSATLRTDASAVRVCHAGLATGRAGVVQRRLTTTFAGMVRATLAAGGRTDWDLAIFDAATGRNIAGSAYTGTNEVAEGAVAAGTDIVVQACRRSGTAAAELRVVDTALGAVDPYPGRLVRVSVPTQAAKDLLVSLGLDLTHSETASTWEAALYEERDERKLRDSGLSYTTLIADLPAADRAALSQRATEGPPAPMPSGRTEYRRLADFSADMKTLASENPTIAKPIVLKFKSLEGRPVEGIEISKDVQAADGKPVFIQFGVHHAREWPSSEMPMEWAVELVNGLKNKDERITKLLEQTRVIVVPVVNPDGYNLSREAPVDSRQPVVDPDFAYKRKNCRIVDGAVPGEGECGQQANRSLGTDPNRNYGGFWGGPGAASTPSDDTYRGAGPFSEPESQNVRALISERQAVTVITNHTYSDLVLRPPGIKKQGDSVDEAAYKAFGDAMAAENGYTSQKSFDLYDTTGTTEDWSYYATGGYGFTFEIGKASDANTLVGVGFHPPYPTGVIAEYYGKYPTGGGNREAYFIALEHSAEPKNHAVLTGSAPAGSTIKLTRTFMTEVFSDENVEASAAPFQDTLATQMTVPASGQFTYHVNQSTRPITLQRKGPAEAWTLTCETPDGKIAGRQAVVVGRSESKALGNVCNGVSAPAVKGGFSVKVTKPGKTALKRALKKGVAFSVKCSSACSLAASLVVDKRTAKKAKLGKKAVTLAKASRQAPEGQARFALKIKGKAARLKSLKATLKVVATAANGVKTTRSIKLTLKR